jgi:hypothetical protein
LVSALAACAASLRQREMCSGNGSTDAQGIGGSPGANSISPSSCVHFEQALFFTFDLRPVGPRLASSVRVAQALRNEAPAPRRVGLDEQGHLLAAIPVAIRATEEARKRRQHSSSERVVERNEASPATCR